MRRIKRTAQPPRVPETRCDYSLLCPRMAKASPRGACRPGRHCNLDIWIGARVSLGACAPLHTPADYGPRPTGEDPTRSPGYREHAPAGTARAPACAHGFPGAVPRGSKSAHGVRPRECARAAFFGALGRSLLRGRRKSRSTQGPGERYDYLDIKSQIHGSEPRALCSLRAHRCPLSRPVCPDEASDMHTRTGPQSTRGDTRTHLRERDIWFGRPFPH